MDAARIHISWWGRAQHVAAEFVRLFFQIVMILLGAAICRWCFLSLLSPLWRPGDEPPAIALGFKVYWFLFMLACGIGGGAMAIDQMVDLVNRAIRLSPMHPVLALKSRAFRVVGGFCKLMIAGGMVTACITGLVMLPGKWRSVDGQTIGELLAMTIGLPIWGGIAIALGVQQVLPLVRRIWDGNGADDQEPPPRPFDGDPVPTPRRPEGSGPLAAHAIPPRG